MRLVAGDVAALWWRQRFRTPASCGQGGTNRAHRHASSGVAAATAHRLSRQARSRAHGRPWAVASQNPKHPREARADETENATGRHCGRRRDGRHRCLGPEQAAVDRHRRHRRRLLSAGRRLRQHPRQGAARRHGDRAGHGRVGRQPAADRLGQGGYLLHPGGRGLGRHQRQGQVRQRQAADPGTGRHVPQPHARGHGRRHRHHQSRGHEGQARVHRLARQRHRGLRAARDRGRRARPGEGHAPGASRRGGERQRAQGPQDRGVLLGGRTADGGGDRILRQRPTPRSRSSTSPTTRRR